MKKTRPNVENHNENHKVFVFYVFHSVHFIYYVRFDAFLPLPDAEIQFHPSDHKSYLPNTIPSQLEATIQGNS